MDDDKEKSAIEKMIDKVNDAVENMVITASAAAMKAMEPEPDPEQVAGTTNEQVYIPEATDAAAVPAPLFAAPAKKKRALPKTTAVKATAPKKSAKKSTRKKTAKKAAAKASKKIHTTPQTELITAVLSAEHIVELARLRDFQQVREVGTYRSGTKPTFS
jgi:cell division septation protein DedD